METCHVQIGNAVFWNDPDGNECSGPAKITEIKTDGEPIDNDTIIVITKHNGGEAETTAEELELLTDSLSLTLVAPKEESCTFVNASDLFSGFTDLWNEFGDSEPDMSWGDNNRTLNTVESILDSMENSDIDVPGRFKFRCEATGLQTYVDLEN